MLLVQSWSVLREEEGGASQEYTYTCTELLKRPDGLLLQRTLLADGLVAESIMSAGSRNLENPSPANLTAQVTGRPDVLGTSAAR